ncbi:uracil DNA glycosylase [Ascosphaera aggregata]|nr:uracil DNA glycosylase [Ascosphaera aggregata]
MAWGTPAGQRVAKIDRKRHLVLQAVHPSPLSAHRGFLKCGHFKQANEWLAQRYGEDGPIDWSLVPSDKSGEQTKSSVTTESATSEITTVAKAKTDKTARRMENAHDGEFDDDELEALLASEEGLN